MDKVYIIGQMVENMMVNGNLIKCMDTVYLLGQKMVDKNMKVYKIFFKYNFF